MKRKLHLMLTSSLACLILSGCGDPQTTGIQKNPTAYTVNYPLAYFAERIAGDQAEIVFPNIEGDPAFWKPNAAQIVEFQNANIILLNGATYAKWTEKASLPKSALVDTSFGFHHKFIGEEGDVAHSHGPDGFHTHGEVAFTTWLDPQQAIAQAAAIDKKLDVSDSGFQQLKKDLQALDKQWAEAFTKLAGQPLLGSHPVYQYLSRRYNLKLESVHWEPDVVPDAASWTELNTVLKTHPAKVMFWEDQPLPETEKRLTDMGIQSVIFDPCGNRPDSGDFLSVMKQNAKNLEAVSIQ